MLRMCCSELHIHMQSCLQLAKEVEKEYNKMIQKICRWDLSLQMRRRDEGTLIQFTFGSMFDPMFVMAILYNFSLVGLYSEILMLHVTSRHRTKKFVADMLSFITWLSRQRADTCTFFLKCCSG
jgi:hypothetical protein